MVNEELVLTRDCEATIVPSGDTVVLEKGTSVYISQALGGTVTVRTEMGLFRIGHKDLGALGDEVASNLNSIESTKKQDDRPFGEDLVWDALKECYDPEIPINIVDLGLIYDLAITDLDDGSKHIDVKMTLTAQGCGMGPVIAQDAKEKIEAIPGVIDASVDIVWDPAWNPQMISENGRKILGLT